MRCSHRMVLGAGLAAALLAGAPRSAALGPHEVAVVVNEASGDSVRVAEAFVRIRSVPASNVVRVRLPREGSVAGASVTPDEFRRRIYEPVSTALRERGLGHVLAWAYSVDFPTAVATGPEVSLTGMTFVRGRALSQGEIEKALYESPLYAGPDGTGDEPHYPQSLDALREWVGSENMPVPAMMLGVTGPRGNAVEVIVKCLEASRAADGTAPTGTVFFVRSDDIRSKCREWQFRGAVAELAQAGVRAEIVEAMPPRGLPVAGLMVGSAVVDPLVSGPYLGGCMAEHLTSLAGVFSSASQTKLTAWIGAGAAASCGAVSEPLSAWPKFPHARFFAHMAAGCTMAESFAQSVRSPLQLLLVGDPLASPWVRCGDASLTIRGVGDRTRGGKVRVEAVLEGRDAPRYRRVTHYLDGRRVADGAAAWLDLSTVPAGAHVLRCVAYGTGLVRPQVFGEKSFTVVSE